MLKSGIIKNVEVVARLVEAILNNDESIKSVVFRGQNRYDVYHRDFPWFYVEFPEKCRVIVYDCSVFIQEV